jgi:hypothetical protein
MQKKTNTKLNSNSVLISINPENKNRNNNNSKKSLFAIPSNKNNNERTQSGRNSDIFNIKTNSVNNSFRLDDSFSSKVNYPKDIKNKNFTPSFYSKVLLDHFIPENKKVSKLKMCKVLNEKNQIDNKQRERNNSFSNNILKIEEKVELEEIRNNKIYKFNKDQKLFLKKECSHHKHEDSYINNFLTPINKSLNKEFKVDFLKMIPKELKLPKIPNLPHKIK